MRRYQGWLKTLFVKKVTTWARVGSSGLIVPILTGSQAHYATVLQPNLCQVLKMDQNRPHSIAKYTWTPREAVMESIAC
jgi:hypothetical protein